MIGLLATVYNERIRVFALYIRQNLGIHSWRTVGVLQAGNDLLYDLSRVLSLHATSCAPERNWSSVYVSQQ